MNELYCVFHFPVKIFPRTVVLCASSLITFGGYGNLALQIVSAL